MSRHSQRPDNSRMVCLQCKADRCKECVDVLRVVYTDEMICKCTRRFHAGEPRDQQIADPETGAIHAPGLTVTKDGEVKHG